MNPERWRQITAILHPALALAPESRASFLRDACGADEPLRQEVESLIAAAEKSAWIDDQVFPVTVTIESTPVPDGGQMGPYKILHKLGEGGMGVVYKAVDTRLGRTVALKVLLPDHGSWQQRERFAREAKAASTLNHPNIVTIYEFDAIDGVEFIAMEYVDGESLYDLQTSHRASRDQMLGYLRQAAGAIAKAHEAGMIHRDLKPNNIMVTKEGVAKVLDFGLAIMEAGSDEDPDATKALTLTRAGMAVGTPAYMSPEQVKGEPVDRRTDIFSFGIILYEVACGQRPFKGANPQATLHQIATMEPQAPTEVDPTIPAKLTRLIAQCLQKDPSKRTVTMAGVAQELGDLPQPATAPVALSRRVAAASAGVALLVVGLGWWLTRSSPPERSLTASIIAQRMKDGAAASEPYVASLNETFESGWRFRLRAESTQAGYFYVLSDGPDDGGVNRLWMLSKLSLSASQPAETGWNVFDNNPGTERLALVWAREPVADLEKPPSGSLVTDPSLAIAIRDILAPLKPVDPSKFSGTLELRGNFPILGAVVELRHR